MFDGYCGTSPKSRKNVRIITELAWQHHFSKNMFIRPDTEAETEGFEPDFTIINACKVVNDDYKVRSLFIYRVKELDANSLKEKSCVHMAGTALRGRWAGVCVCVLREMTKGAFHVTPGQTHSVKAASVENNSNAHKRKGAHKQ